MSIKFTTPDPTQRPSVVATVSLDVDGDVLFELNGQTVAYISSRTGRLIRWGLCHPSRALLEAAGIKFDSYSKIERDD